MKVKVARSRRPEVVDDASGFAGLFDASALLRYRRPLLATSTDGVGTKVDAGPAAGQARHDRHRPGRHGRRRPGGVRRRAAVHDRLHRLRQGRARADRRDRRRRRRGLPPGGRALVGGETAEHPGAMGADEYDLAGAGTGVVEADAMLGPARVREGDVVLGLASSGVHSNGYSLVRHVIKHAGLDLDTRAARAGAARWARSCWSRPGSTHSTAWSWPARSTCTPTRTSPAAAWSATCPARCRADLDAVLDRSSWTPPADLRGARRARRGDAGRTWTAPSTWASAWPRSSPAEAADAAIAAAGAARGPARVGAGRDRPGHRPKRCYALGGTTKAPGLPWGFDALERDGHRAGARVPCSL